MPRHPPVQKYKPTNPQKYRGDVGQIFYRSSYELTFMRWCDTNPNVLEWSSEEVVIPYRTILDEEIERRKGLTYKRWHRYYVDFYVKRKTVDGRIIRTLVEVKPYHETVEPIFEGTRKSRKTKLTQQKTWIVNNAKWAAARRYCADHGMEFMIVTEKQLYGR